MLSEKMQIALNKQINAEFYSAYLYLSMSMHFEAKGLNGFAHWFKAQFDEEQGHAMKIAKFINERGGKVVLEDVKAHVKVWDKPLLAFEETLAHEKVVTGFINDLVVLAKAEQDFATENFLKWFVDEQVEEEATAQGIVDALTLIADNGFGIYTFDRELGNRQ